MPPFLDRFSRIHSKNREYIPEIDGLRFFAILAVVLYHLQTHWLRIQPEGMQQLAMEHPLFHLVDRLGLGVYVFFTISGFILALPFAQHHLQGAPKPILKRYYSRRLTRIEPPYLIAMLLLFFVGLGTHRFSFTEALPHLAASLGYVHHFVYGEWSSINPVAWSLEVEVQFYLLAPFFGLLFAIRQPPLRWAALLISLFLFVIITWQGYQTLDEYHLEKSLLTAGQYFLLGVLLAEVYLTRWKDQVTQFPWVGDILTLLGMFLLWFGKHNLHLTNQILFLAGTFLLFYGAFRGRWVRAFFRQPWLTTIGGMCYSIYLWHYAFIVGVLPITTSIGQNVGYPLSFLIQILITLPLLLTLSALYFRWFERPFMNPNWLGHLQKWRKRIGTNKKSL
ncbi:MAG TPA: hypothetical protein DCE41_06340 [Cytophagales bacterium]|nr:hypothetical protein [Cytophagales bacterium]HAA19559.1 hypothetical protein [Cytophagales bacterium]HAP63191.1 hypothetical protein [Cytophagales bacterium]